MRGKRPARRTHERDTAGPIRPTEIRGDNGGGGGERETELFVDELFELVLAQEFDHHAQMLDIL